MKNKDEQTGLVGLAIGAAVIGLVSARNRSIVTALLMNC
ncbi:signal peptide protein [Enterobacter cloacae]|uniref:Signal peptide protein n=1 Tax=Enterobacter cloacae TaxID=550 RepID=A0A377M099_ENTCL|nr:signal peptide protein [Enterobacter cloacae]